VPKGSIERVGLEKRFNVISELRPDKVTALNYERRRINNISRRQIIEQKKSV
jgi:hypothetical protein